MDRVIKIRYELVDSVTAQTNNVVNGLSTINKEIQRNSESTKKSVKSADSSLAELGKKFLTIAVAVKAAKFAFGVMIDSLKEFDRVSKGSAVKDFQNAIGQLQVEIGSVLYPELIKFNKWFEENKTTITLWVTGVSSIIASLVKISVVSLDLIKNSFEEIVYIFFTAVSHLARDLLKQMYEVASRLPIGDKIKEGLKGAYEYMTIVGEDFQKGMNKTALNIGKNFKTLGGEIVNIGKQIAGIATGVSPNASRIKFISEEDLRKQQKALEDWLKSLEKISEDAKAMMVKAKDYSAEVASKYADTLYYIENGQELQASSTIIAASNEYEKLKILHSKIEDEYYKFYESAAKIRIEAAGKGQKLLNEAVAAELRSFKAYLIVREANKKESERVISDITRQKEAERLAIIEEQARYELSVKEHTRSTDIASIDAYFLTIIETYKDRYDEILQVSKEYERKRAEAVRSLRQEYTSATTTRTRGTPEDTRSGAQTSLDAEVLRRSQIYGDMVSSLKFTEEELSKYRISLEQYTVDEQLKIDQAYTDAKMQNIQSQFQAYADIANKLIEVGQNVTQMQLNNLDRETEAKNKQLDDAYNMDTKYVKNASKLDKQYKDAKDKLAEEQAQKQRELYKKQKGWSIANALIAGAEASMNSWVQAMKLGYPANVIVGGIMQGVIATLTASQVAMIGSQKFATGGIVQGPTTGDKVTIQANGGEMMLTTGQQARLYQALNGQGTLGQQVTISGDTFIVHGNLDKNAADQVIRQKEQRISTLKQDLRELNYRGQLSFAA